MLEIYQYLPGADEVQGGSEVVSCFPELMA